MINQLDLSLFKTSSAGTTVSSSEEDLEVVYKYNPVNWLFITCLGTTRMPSSIKFYCKKEAVFFEEVKDRKRIEHYMRFRRK